MFEFLQWRILKKGMSPGSLTYAGEDHDFKPQLCEYEYDATSLEEKCLHELPSSGVDAAKVHLLHLIGVHDAVLVGNIGRGLGIHPLLVEDILNTGQRSKFHADEDAVFMVFKDVDYQESEKRHRQYQLGLYWTGDAVLAFQEHDSKPWEGVTKRLRSGKGRMRSAGSSYLVVAMIDALIDKYYEVLGDLSRRAEELESGLAQRQTEDALMELFALKRESVMLRTTFVAARDCLDKLGVQEVQPIPDQNRPYLADVRDHAQQIVDTATALHDILSDMLNVHISLAGMRMNSVMKVLTVIATIFIPLTFLTGIYGMNFQNIPELRYEYGYPIFLTVMFVLLCGMVWYFKRKEWF